MKNLLNLGLCMIFGSFFNSKCEAIAPGEKIPNFEVKNQNGINISPANLMGQAYLLYFYPKDDTPGCTLEAQKLRDDFPNFKKHGIKILGVSTQNEKSHLEFIQKYQLPFDLLVDSDSILAKSLGVRTIPILSFHKRQSLLVSKEGTLIKFYEKVDPKVHSSEVIMDFEEYLSSKSKP